MPADLYGVGSWLLSSCDDHGTANDFTADVVRVKIDGRWVRHGQDRPPLVRQPDAGAGRITLKKAPRRERRLTWTTHKYLDAPSEGA